MRHLGPMPRHLLALCGMLLANTFAHALEPVAVSPAVSLSTDVTTTDSERWSRVVCIGASVTAGFDAGAPFGGPRTAQHALWRHVDASIAAPHAPVQSFADTMVFTG